MFNRCNIDMRETPSILEALRRLGLDGTSGVPAVQLTSAEATWLSGYFAGLAQAPGLAPHHATPPVTSRVCVLYGSETGNAASLARRLGERLCARGATADVRDLASFKARALERERAVVFITSTHGDGDPPESARSFFEALHGASAPRSLAEVRFAVLGLGDSSYEHFCEAARVLDERLATLGAVRLCDRVDCDLDFEEQASVWMDALMQRLELRAPSQLQVQSQQPHVPVVGPGHAQRGYDRTRPFQATVLENFAITGRGSSKETRHLALSLEGAHLRYEPGDALGICAPNDPALVDALLAALAMTGDEAVEIGGRSHTLREALLTRCDVCVPSDRFLRAWAEASQAQQLAALKHDEASDARRAFLRAHQLLDIVSRHPAKRVTAQDLVGWLRPLSPRLYSVASSLSAVPEEVHLTVGVVRYLMNGRQCTGVASGHLAARVAAGQQLPVYVHANASFRLPEDPALPVIMIGAGTGVAPFRAFIQERSARGARGRSWLFFGERNFRTDFLYQTEWQAALRDQQLTKLTLAFSRDQASKVYVQHRLREHGRELYAWLQEGGHVYVCGDAQALAPAVHEALLSVLQEHTGSRERAVEQLGALSEQGRYRRDVY